MADVCGLEPHARKGVRVRLSGSVQNKWEATSKDFIAC